MGLQPIENKKIISEMKTGTHLATISDMFYLKNSTKEMQLIDGHPAIVVRFKDGKNRLHEQVYIIDGALRQKYFENMIRAAQISMANGAPKKSEALGKRLWISIQECHTINDDQVMLRVDGSEWIDYYIFRVYPFIEGSKKPSIKGDPESNGGIPTGDFITYKNISESQEADFIEGKGIIKQIKENPVQIDTKNTVTKEQLKDVIGEPDAPIFETDEDEPGYGPGQEPDDEQVPQF